jgi:hypothetical protein
MGLPLFNKRNKFMDALNEIGKRLENEAVASRPILRRGVVTADTPGISRTLLRDGLSSLSWA